MDKRVLFAQALAAAIRGDRVNWDGVCGQQEWKDLFLLAQQHRVVPLILEAVYACPDFGTSGAVNSTAITGSIRNDIIKSKQNNFIKKIQEHPG